MAERVSINEAMPLLQGIVEWDELGLYLGLSDAVIKEIRSAYGDVSTKRMLMMSKWIQSDLEATWSKLAKALLKMNPPYKVVAAKIRQQRGLSPEIRKELGAGEKCKLVEGEGGGWALPVHKAEAAVKIYNMKNIPKATTNCIVVSRPGCRFNSMWAGGLFLLFIIYYYRMWYYPQMAAGSS